MKIPHIRVVLVAFCVTVAILSAARAHPAAQQTRARLNKIIEQVEQGNAAISGQHWLFIDQEHSPYVIDKLEERATQLLLHSRINYSYRRMQEYLTSKRTWGARYAGVLWARPVAYFSAEFGLHESIPIYSGGLGVLAGLGALYFVGVAAVAALLAFEQSLVSETDLSQVKRAFDLNGYVGILYFVVTALSIYAGR